jgi:transcriptional regulator with XRE-family HTH domain
MTMLGQRIVSLRVARGLTTMELSQLSHLDLSFIWELERGRRIFVTPYDVERLAHALSVPQAILWKCVPQGNKKMPQSYCDAEAQV